MGYYAAIAGAAVKVAGTVMGGKAEAKAADQQATQVQAEAKARAAVIRLQAKTVRGAARADFAASGVALDTGSVLLADRTITQRSELDALNAIAGGNATASSIRQSGRARLAGSYYSALGQGLSSYGAASGGGGGG
jgi:hypothetical protein